MKRHTLSGCHRKNKYGLIVLAVPVLFVLAGLSNSSAQQDQSITLTTNKGTYLPGDTVQVSGMITGQPSALVAIQVKDSDGNLILIRTLQADKDGNFAVEFKIPPTATSGKFSIIASSKIGGFVVTQTKVIEASVPEFGEVAAQVLVLSTIFTILVFARSDKLRKLT
jgi:hypothetical protein